MASHHQPPSASGGDRIRFDGGGAFHAELKQRVAALLREPGRARRAQRRMYVKSAVMAVWLAASWAGLVLLADSAWQAGLLAVSLGLAMAGLAFNVTHDANHGSWSPHRRLNRAMAWTLDLLGASSYIWRTKHNVVHHTYTNIDGADSDIDSMPFARFAPAQPRRVLHRFQHLYIWVLYGLFAIKWHTVGDFGYLRTGRIGETPVRWPRGRDAVGFWAGKAGFVTWSVAIPLLLHPAWQVAIAFGVVSFVLALTLAVTFQLAHCVDEAEFSSTEEMRGAGRVDWARHQIETTVDFAPRSRLLAWYMGGLNFQVEHHLFSRVAHTHYPAMARVVREVCERHGVRHRSHPSLWSALASHARWLREMGRPEPAAPAPAAPAPGAPA
ncbi:fatty acid desaturase family protein [Miltoncostaea marina]|uniref:fatty acid desaturase family protein n=1 Tax=Miltoncostaea marina TaxID=2843215 RepID=UPI001C3E3BB1|nr:acyl-CoA desaturase [Miltoncostaea marina]